MKKIFFKISLFAFIIATVTACKKDEEDFDLKTDLLTPIIAFNSASIPDEHALWRVERVKLSRTSRNYASNFLEILNDDDAKFPPSSRPHFIGFAEENCIHTDFVTIAGTVKETFGTWQILNNDKIYLDSLDVFPGVSSSYFDIELRNEAYQDSTGLANLIGADVQVMGTKWDRIVKKAPSGKIEYLKLIVDKKYPNHDNTSEIHFYSQIYLSRIIPKLGTLSTRKVYE